MKQKQNKKINKKLKQILLHQSKNIFIMGHQDLDLDALGSSIGMNELLKQYHKNCFLVIDDETNELGVQKILTKIKDKIKIINSTDIKEHLHPNKRKNVLLILDTNKLNLISNSSIIENFERKVIIDHHDSGSKSIPSDFMWIDYEASSTCEMITDLLQINKKKVSPFVATTLLAGIVLDTNNFTLKTTKKTYYAAYYLTKLGADPIQVQYILKQDLKQYIERQKTITSSKIIHNTIAIAVSSPQTIYRREDLAKIADTLLFFNDIEASFVVGKISDVAIGISARSMGTIKVQEILESMGGGGNRYNAATKIENHTLEDIEKELLINIKKYKEGLK